MHQCLSCGGGIVPAQEEKVPGIAGPRYWHRTWWLCAESLGRYRVGLRRRGTDPNVWYEAGHQPERLG